MFLLTIELATGKPKVFSGNTRKNTLEKFKTFLTQSSDQDMHGAMLVHGISDLRTFIVRDDDDTDNIECWPDNMKYGVDTENCGVSETRYFATRPEINDFFFAIASEDGWHWD